MGSHLYFTTLVNDNVVVQQTKEPSAIPNVGRRVAT